jgi:hypothetical protein
MARVRISTTVDEHRLARARKLTKEQDSSLMDRALQALIDEIEAVAELRAIQAKPYDADEELSWDVADDPLPYDGDVPLAVVERARAMRRARKKR